MAKQREPITHELKIWPEYYEPVSRYRKNFELRRGDRDFQVGDQLSLREWDPISGRYTGRVCRRSILYILRHSSLLKEGGVILGLNMGSCVSLSA